MNNPWSCLFTDEFSIFHPIESDFLPPKTQRHFEDPKNTAKNRVIHPKPWRRVQPGDSQGKRDDCQDFFFGGGAGSYCHADRTWSSSPFYHKSFDFSEQLGVL